MTFVKHLRRLSMSLAVAAAVGLAGAAQAEEDDETIKVGVLHSCPAPWPSARRR
jgi:hypothetical protein